MRGFKKRGFKKFTGNYKQVVTSIGLHADFYANNGSKQRYINEVERDIERIPYLNFNSNVAAMQKQLCDTDSLQEDQLSYAQGNFDGSFFTGAPLTANQNFLEQCPKAQTEGTLSDLKKTVSFHYVDDDGAACGFAITYLRDDSNTDIKANKRPLSFNVAIIKNVTMAVEKREVTYFTHTALLLPDTIKGDGQDIEASSLAQEIEMAVNCKSVNQLLSGILNKGTIVLKPFLELEARLRGGLNIDDRDPKLDQLFDLFLMWARLACIDERTEEQNNVMQELLGIINEAYQNVNYFKDKDMDAVRAVVASYQNNKLIPTSPLIDDTSKQTLMSIVETYQVSVTRANAQLNKQIQACALKSGYSSSEEIKAKLEQSFLQRNLAGLLIMSLAVVSIVLTLTGILAPVGLIIGVVVGVLVACRMASNEKKLETVQSLISTHSKTIMEPLDVQYHKDIMASIRQSNSPDDGAASSDKDSNQDDGTSSVPLTKLD